jgi:ABC-type transport system involved in multi-copper enzyme maturation permease subunit
MNSIVIIALNFLRQMRWLVLIYLFIAVLLGAGLSLTDKHMNTEVLGIYLGQLAVYANLMGILLASQAIVNERRSRRILGVLSKSLGRRDYLAGLLCGVFACTAALLAGVLLGALCMAARGWFPSSKVFAAILLMWLACCLSAAMAIFFSTFLHPRLAILGTFILIGSGWVARFLQIPSSALFPVYQLNLDASQLLQNAGTQPLAIPVAVLEIIIFWLLAGWIFERRDIAVAIE